LIFYSVNDIASNVAVAVAVAVAVDADFGDYVVVAFVVNTDYGSFDDNLLLLSPPCYYYDYDGYYDYYSHYCCRCY
jgi:hypothetical protein